MATLNTRDSRDAARARHVQVKNRRRRYLEVHPEYLDDASRELADPLLYDRLVRRFMSSEEREQQGRERGFAGALEASFSRSEAKLMAVQHPDLDQSVSYARGVDGAIYDIEQDDAAKPANRDEGWRQWVEIVTDRFVQGQDHDLEYAAVDDNEDYDDLTEQERDQLEAYLDEDEGEEVLDGTPQAETGIQDF